MLLHQLPQSKNSIHIKTLNWSFCTISKIKILHRCIPRLHRNVLIWVLKVFTLQKLDYSLKSHSNVTNVRICCVLPTNIIIKYLNKPSMAALYTTKFTNTKSNIIYITNLSQASYFLRSNTRDVHHLSGKVVPIAHLWELIGMLDAS